MILKKNWAENNNKKNLMGFLTERKGFQIFCVWFLMKKRFWDITPLKKYFTIEAELLKCCLYLPEGETAAMFSRHFFKSYFFTCCRMWIFWSLQLLDEKVMRCPFLIMQLQNPCWMITSSSVSHSMLELLWLWMLSDKF